MKRTINYYRRRASWNFAASWRAFNAKRTLAVHLGKLSNWPRGLVISDQSHSAINDIHRLTGIQLL